MTLTASQLSFRDRVNIDVPRSPPRPNSNHEIAFADLLLKHKRIQEELDSIEQTQEKKNSERITGNFHSCVVNISLNLA